jgi:hypothetical protein
MVRKPLTLISGKVSELPDGDSVEGGGSIPQLMADPIAPAAQSAWVRANPISTAGSPIGLLLALTQATSTFTYELRYRTLEGITVGVPLT